MASSRLSSSFSSCSNSSASLPLCASHLSPSFSFCSNSSVTFPVCDVHRKLRSFHPPFACRLSNTCDVLAGNPLMLKDQGGCSENHFKVVHQSHRSCATLHEQDVLNQQKRRGILVAAFLVFANVSLPLPNVALNYLSIGPANAILFAPNARVPRTGEVALRRAIPANSSMKNLQSLLEDISFLLRIPQRKPYATMEGNVKKALKIAETEKDSILGSIPPELNDKGFELYNTLVDGKGLLQSLLQYIKDQDPDKVSSAVASSLDTVAEMELLQAPGLSFLLPEQFSEYPRLTGRAIVEFTIVKPNGATFTPKAGEEPKNVAKIQVVVDGFSAPLTAGNFAKLVIDGAYDGTKVDFANQAILSEDGQSKIGNSLPLEIMPAGQFEPLYRTTLSVQDGELPVLPLSVYGAVAMAHNADSEDFSAPSQFFFYLYDKKNSGLGGICFEEGQFSVFGYTTEGREILSQIESGDVIQSAKLLQGRERLLLPSH